MVKPIAKPLPGAPSSLHRYVNVDPVGADELEVTHVAASEIVTLPIVLFSAIPSNFGISRL